MFFTVAKHSKDAMSTPPKVKAKALLPLCNRNNINFCAYRGALYH